MKKHILTYSVLIAVVTVLLVMVFSFKKKDAEVNMITLPDFDMPSIEGGSTQVERLKTELKKKEQKIASLRKTIDRKAKTAAKNPAKEREQETEDSAEAPRSIILNDTVSWTGASSLVQSTKRKYFNFLKKLNLNEEEEKELLELLSKRNSVGPSLDVSIVGSKATVVGSNPIFDENSEPEKSLQDYLGEDYEKLRKHDRTEKERKQLKEIVASLNEGSELTEGQVDELVDLMSRRNEDRRNGSGLDDEEYLDSAAEFLYEDQIDELRKSFKREIIRSQSADSVISGGSQFTIEIDEVNEIN